MEPIYCVQVIKTVVSLILAVVVLDGTVRNPRKCTVASQSVTKSEYFICYMTFKYADGFLCARRCSSGGKGIPFALDACANAHIFIENDAFFRFGPVLARLSGNGTIKFFSLITIKNKVLLNSDTSPRQILPASGSCYNDMSTL